MIVVALLGAVKTILVILQGIADNPAVLKEFKYMILSVVKEFHDTRLRLMPACLKLLFFPIVVRRAQTPALVVLTGWFPFGVSWVGFGKGMGHLQRLNDKVVTVVAIR